MSEKPQAWFNGTMVPWEAVNVPVLSHGLSRGSAIFEVFGVQAGPDSVHAYRMDDHLKRLERTKTLLGMNLAYSIEDIKKAVSELAEANKFNRGIIKIIAFWGEEAVFDLVLKSKLDLAIFTIPISEEQRHERMSPIAACISKWRKLHPETIPVEAKACANYLNGYLAKKDAMTRGFDLGILLGTDGFIAESAMESVFIVKDGVLKTPPLGRVLKSISRDSILKLAAAENIDVMETCLKPDDLYEADEIFFCSTGAKVSSVKRFEDRQLAAPGAVSKHLSEAFEAIFRFEDQRFSSWFQKLY